MHVLCCRKRSRLLFGLLAMGLYFDDALDLLLLHIHSSTTTVEACRLRSFPIVSHTCSAHDLVALTQRVIRLHELTDVFRRALPELLALI